MFKNTLLGIASAFALSAVMLAGPVAAADSNVESAVESVAEQAENYVIETGTKMPDFTVETQNGTFTLSEELKTHDMVLLNFWATWCPGCKAELPYLQEAADSRDDVSMLLLSTDPTDTMEKIQAFEDEFSYTLNFAAGGSNVASWYQFPYIPGTVIIDRNGMVSYAQAEGFINTAAVNRLLDEFAGSDYETHVVEEIPAAEPTVAAEDQQTLEDVLGSGFTFTTEDGDWPMVSDTEEKAVCSSNTEVETTASLNVDFTADGGMAFDVKVDKTAPFDILKVYLDGELVKSFRACDWKTWMIPAEGKHTVRFEYRKSEDGMGFAKLANFRLLTAEEAAQNPVYPESEETEVRLLAPARKVNFHDPELTELLGVESVWIADSDEVQAFVRLAGDPDASFLSGSADEDLKTFGEEEISGDGFLVAKKIRTEEDNPITVFYLIGSTNDEMKLTVVLSTEKAMEKMPELTGYDGDWSYDLEETADAGSAAEGIQTAESVEEAAE